MADELGPTQTIAEFVVNTSIKDIPKDALEGAKSTFLDTLGCGIAALSQPVARSIFEHVRSLGGEPVSTVMGAGGYKTSPVLASLANGCFVNILDWDGFLHAPTFVLPPALAIGEMVAATGAQVLEAYTLAIEAAARMRQTIDAQRGDQAGPTYRGWYHVSLYGPIAAALTACKLLGLNVEQTRGAMGAAVCGSGGVRQNLGTHAKSLASGNSASFGVSVALLAQRGVTGDPEILEARLGLVSAVCLPGEYDWAPIMKQLGNAYTLSGPLELKAFPAVGPTQGVLGTLLILQRETGFTGSDVDRMEARLWAFSAGTDYPEDPLDAGFCWPYVLAAAMLDGRFGPNHLTEASLHDQRIRELASRIEFTRPATKEEPET